MCVREQCDNGRIEALVDHAVEAEARMRDVALRRMIDLVSSTTPLTRNQAFMLMSLAADVHVTQLINEHKGIHVMLPKSALPV